MEWQVEFTKEFGRWWDDLNPEEQEDVDASVRLIEKYGPTLPFPHSSGVKRSKHTHMRELRVQHKAGLIGYCMLSIRYASRFC